MVDTIYKFFSDKKGDFVEGTIVKENFYTVILKLESGKHIKKRKKFIDLVGCKESK